MKARGETARVSVGVCDKAAFLRQRYAPAESHAKSVGCCCAGYGSTVDWWGYGVLVYEMLYGSTPFKGSNDEQTFHNICQVIVYASPPHRAPPFCRSSINHFYSAKHGCVRKGLFIRCASAAATALLLCCRK